MAVIFMFVINVLKYLIMPEEQFVSPKLMAWWATIHDFETSVEELIVCNWFIKTQHIRDMYLLVNT